VEEDEKRGAICYCVASGGTLLWVIVWRVVISYGLLCGEWW
jgi:hypothetical protein